MTRRTIVFLHAHPDDETLLTGGTLARLHAAGHRTVVVVATDGALGLTASRPARARPLADVRGDELERACTALGVDRIVRLGYPDSGTADDGPVDRFTTVPTPTAAARVAQLLIAEAADVLVTYDRAGGYGHPDHIHAHHVGLAAARLARTPSLLQATVDRRLLRRGLRAIGWLPGLPDGFDASAVAARFTAHADLTHRVDVRAHLAAKRTAMAAHASQTTADNTDRTLAWALRLPRPLFRLAFGHEWFVEVGRAPGTALLGDPLATFATATPPVLRSSW